MERIGGILGKLLRETGSHDLLILADIDAHWEEIVGEALGCKTRPLKFLKGTLYLAAESPAWAQEALFMQEAIREHVRKTTGHELKGIRSTAQRPLARPKEEGAGIVEKTKADADPLIMVERAQRSYKKNKQRGR